MHPGENLDRAQCDEMARIQSWMAPDVFAGRWKSYWRDQFQLMVARQLPLSECLEGATRATFACYGVPELRSIAEMIEREWNLDPDMLDQGIRWRSYYLRMRPQYDAARRRAYNRTIRYINGHLKRGKDRRWRRSMN